MENQHRQITGYRDLTQEEIDLMNEIKAKGAELDELIVRINLVNANLEGPEADHLRRDSECYRWGSMAKTSLQLGIMQLTRAIAKPAFF